jgi:hypothetical protein
MILTVKQKYFEKNLPQCHFVHPDPVSTGQSNLGAGNSRLGTHCLSYSMASVNFILCSVVCGVGDCTV